MQGAFGAIRTLFLLVGDWRRIQKAAQHLVALYLVFVFGGFRHETVRSYEKP